VRGLIVKLALLTAAGLFSVGWLAVQIGQLGGPAGQFSKTQPISAAFTDATGLLPGDEVRMAGVRVGKVGGVDVDRGKAKVELKIDKRFDLPEGSRFELRWRNLLGQRFVQVLPPEGADPNGPAMAAGDVVGTDRTAAAADLSKLLNNSEPLLADLDTEGVNKVMATMATAIQGRQDVLGQAIDESADLVATLSQRADTIGSSMTQMAELLDTVAGHDDEVRRLLGSLAEVSHALAGRSGDLGRAVASTGQFTSVLDRVLASSGGDLDASLTEAQKIARSLASHKKQLSEGVRTFNWAAAAFIRATNTGDWINIYGRSFGVINTYYPEPRVGPDYNDVGPDDEQGPGPWLGEPNTPTPPIPETDAGPATVNPGPDREPDDGSGLDDILGPITGGGS
jgi:phospholipid/cholesterol/gamma-HCH transport system substrate-binding protein